MGNDDLAYEINAAGQQVLVKSKEGHHVVHLRFNNKTCSPVNVWWRDYEGRKKLYLRLEPGSGHDQDSYLTHPWEATDVSTNERYFINNELIYRAPSCLGGTTQLANLDITAAKHNNC